VELSIFQIDAFADRVFGGNPAAICPLDSWIPDDVMQAIAAENNHAETAFFVAADSKDTDGVLLRSALVYADAGGRALRSRNPGDGVSDF
jgi:PhzF family phenazine biosynthesis protein